MKNQAIKSVRGNKVYTIRNHTLESMTCDDNGAQARSNKNKRTFYAEISSRSTVTVRTWRKDNGIIHYKEKIRQRSTKCSVKGEKVFELLK